MSQIKKGLYLFGSLVLVVGFQNCAPGSMSASEDSGDPIVTTFDDKKESDDMRTALGDSLADNRAGGNATGFMSPELNWRLTTYSCNFRVQVVNSSGQRIGIPGSYNGRQSTNYNVAIVNTEAGTLEGCVIEADMGTVVARVCHTEYRNLNGVVSLPDRGVIKIAYSRFSIMSLEDSGSFELQDYPFECRYF